MPVKNTARYLEACLDSIRQQSFENWELIAIDDHSTDDSQMILSRYAKEDHRIRVYPNEGVGIILALRTAFAKCTGKYISRMDSDDKMHKDKLSLMQQQLTKVGGGHVAVGLVEYFSEGALGNGYLKYAHWLNQMTHRASNFDDIYKECSIPSPCWMMSREDLEDCGDFKSDVYPEDYDLAFRMRKANLKIAAVLHVLHYWRDYANRTSRTDPNYADNTFLHLKVAHFLDQDYQPKGELVIWGGGRKGKVIAKLFQRQNIAFRWICNNEKKIGQDIYGVVLEAENAIEKCTNLQLIKAFVTEGEVLHPCIKDKNDKGSKSAEQQFNFC